MEKMAIVRPDVTPDLKPAETAKAAADCVSRDIVDNCKESVIALDADFRKKAADRVSENLDS